MIFKPAFTPKTQTLGFVIFTSLVIFILTVVLFSIFFNRFRITEAQDTAPTRRIQDLVTLLNQAEEKKESLEQELTALRQQSKAMPGKASSPELKRLYQLAGLTPVSGAGIEIVLQDNKQAEKPQDAHQDPNAGKLQADDLLRLINELKSAGATAIAINDQRLVVNSEIIAAGPTITVNQTRLTQPVVVKAMGNPDMLLGALRIRGGILEYLQFFNIKVKAQKRPSVSLPAYQGD